MQPAEPSLPALPRPPSFTRQQTPLLNLADEVNLHDDGPQLSRIAPKDASNLLLALKRPPDECALQFYFFSIPKFLRFGPADDSGPG
jgi:hypothetical protein